MSQNTPGRQDVVFESVIECVFECVWVCVWVCAHLIFFWPATKRKLKSKFGMTKSADLDLHRSFFRSWFEDLEAMSILFVTTDLGHPVYEMLSLCL